MWELTRAALVLLAIVGTTALLLLPADTPLAVASRHSGAGRSDRGTRLPPRRWCAPFR